jgi:hypothetical protein
MGDFAVKNGHRGFGPAHLLPARALEACRHLGMRLVYTVPNADSRLLVERAGFRVERTLRSFVRPVSSSHYLMRGPLRRMPRLVSSTLDTAFRGVCLDSYVLAPGRVVETRTIEDSFDGFWQNAHGTAGDMVAERTAEYLRWRYGVNPHHEFRILTLRGGADGLLGYMVFAEDENGLEIFDLMPTESGAKFCRLLNGLSAIARREGSKAIFMRVLPSHPVAGYLRSCFFVDARDDMVVLVACSEPELAHLLPLSSAERNI